MFDVLGWLNYLLDSAKNIIYAVFISLFNLFKDFMFYIWDSVLSFGEYVITAVTSMLPDMSGVSSQWASVPANAIALLGYCSVDTAIGIIISALIVRLVLNFIPLIG
jgi:hypothetical protein